MQLFIIIIDKGGEILYFCYNRTTYLTELFKKITLLGEWVSLTLLALYLVIKNRKALACALISFIPLDVLLALIKKLLDYPRPLSYFTKGEIIPIENFNPLYRYSMPSGHTFTAFFVATFVATFFSLNRKWQIGLFLSAVFVGISRMYLMCHFKEDVFVGSVLGIIAGILPIFIYDRWFQHR